MSLKKILNDYNIKSIWHFTDRSNLESPKLAQNKQCSSCN